jgi:hypothetical protein
MQTLEPTGELDNNTAPPGRVSRRRAIGLVSVAAVVVVGVVAAAYCLGRSWHSTKRVVVEPAVSSTGSSAAVDDRGFSQLDNGHEAETNFFTAPFDPPTRALLQHQLILARQIAMRYPTVASAEAAGWRRAGPFAPGLGAHFFKWTGADGSGFVPDGPITDAAILSPASLIYDGTDPSAHIAGLMYVGSGTRIPEGFAGQNDIWHYHTDVCYVMSPTGGLDTPYGADTTVTKSMCDGVHGMLLARTPYMLHVWAVPGYDSPQGIFSHDNATITCRDGTYYTIPLDHIGTRTSICVDGGE